jgi:hypothetical protein
VPAPPYNLAFADGSIIGVNDGVILVALKDGHAPPGDYVRKLRTVLPAAFPGSLFYFQPRCAERCADCNSAAPPARMPA